MVLIFIYTCTCIYIIGDDTVAEVLRECELCLTKVIQRLDTGGSEKNMNKRETMKKSYSKLTAHVNDSIGPDMLEREQGGSYDNYENSDKSYGYHLTANISQSVRPYNQRIELNLEDDDVDDTRRIKGNYSNDDNIGDFEDEELTREKVKRASTQILSQVDRKKRRPKKKAASGSESQESEL